MLGFIPGREIFAQRSELNRGVNAFLSLLTMGAMTLVAISLFIALDGRFIGSTLVSQALVMWGGLAILSQMILRREAFRARWGKDAFSVAFCWFAIPGLTLVFVGVAHFAWIEGERVVPRQIALVPVVYLIVTGAWLWFRALVVFGVDNLSMMYVYFPSESRLVNSNVYSVLRHPYYSVVLRMVFALVLWNGSAFTLFAGVMAIASMWVWVRNVEERELIERLGERYESYRTQVPAFFNLNPRAWMTLYRFLIVGT